MSAVGLKRNSIPVCNVMSEAELPLCHPERAKRPCCHPERSAQREVEGSRKAPAANLAAYTVGGGGVDRDASFVVVPSIGSHGVVVYRPRKITRQAKAAV